MQGLSEFRHGKSRILLKTGNAIIKCRSSDFHPAVLTSRVLGDLLCVATSTVAGMNGLLFTTSRLFFVAAREGYLPSCLSMLNIYYFTPVPSLIFIVHISLPLIFLCVCVFLVALPFYDRPWETGIGTAVTLTGIPVYMMILFCSDQTKLFERTAGKLTSVFQKVLLSVPEEKEK
ncbi:large neutral amino acids transporter small subunit 2 [Caerostris extrusa]|uniref:Large neutral amino acids transporter small subunit 2 n=1 Tax=Caerostris extrusa TaxID=172846 RepID=A0AAV4NJS3_CAEEX|nr:large neutral amino acids transporter small subunit 2 [Caerostris extrusa]